jgi:2-amino-4-hydroxy-6-hydroxymethyldihydropteridine diphosphokinase
LTSADLVEAGVAIGSNLGDPARNVTQALEHLAHIPGLTLLRASRLYRSEPWGERDQPDFVNAAAVISTTKSAPDLLRIFREEEKAAGPRDPKKWGPRALDLDLLWYGNEISNEPDLVLPHPEMTRRTFVLMPLHDVAPDWKHPVTKETALEMLDALQRSGSATRCVPMVNVEGGAR